MHLGIFSKTFARTTVEEVFDAVVAQRLSCVQFNFSCAGLPSLPEELELGLLERIRGSAVSRKVSLAAVSGTCNMIHPVTTRRSDGLQRVRIVISACSYVGTNVITLCTGTRDPDDMWRFHPDNHSPEAWSDLRASLDEVLEVAELHDVILGVEPEINNVINSAPRARQLLDEVKSPNLKVVMDPANLAPPGELSRQSHILPEAFDLLGNDLILAHAKELGPDGHPGNLPLGCGLLDWDLYLKLLSRAKFAGALIMHGFEESDLPGSAAFLRDKLAQPV
jgi:sugar phosphate isomerase/epimerase